MQFIVTAVVVALLVLIVEGVHLFAEGVTMQLHFLAVNHFKVFGHLLNELGLRGLDFHDGIGRGGLCHEFVSTLNPTVVGVHRLFGHLNHGQRPTIGQFLDAALARP